MFLQLQFVLYRYSICPCIYREYKIVVVNDESYTTSKNGMEGGGCFTFRVGYDYNAKVLPFSSRLYSQFPLSFPLEFLFSVPFRFSSAQFSSDLFNSVQLRCRSSSSSSSASSSFTSSCDSTLYDDADDVFDLQSLSLIIVLYN